jgi:hypothetical protein
MRIGISIVLILLSFNMMAQSAESDTSYFHSPRKATLLSLALPGAGQVYNKKYWKLPIVYGGIGLSIYYLDRNLKDIRYYKKNLIALQDDDPNTVNETGFNGTLLNTIIDQRKNWRDLSYIAIGVVYGLQILDANVDAHLFYFDVDRDLSLSVLPYIDFANRNTTGIQLSLNF